MSNNRNEARNIFFTAWQKHLQKSPVEKLEAQIIDIILQHPEYHYILNDPDTYQTKDFEGENPFLHLSLHLALYEQISTDRPHGIKQIYQDLCEKFPDALTTQHSMMKCLAEVLWEAQQTGVMPDENNYLSRLRAIKGY